MKTIHTATTAGLVVNAQHMKALPGPKTDVKDAEWIAQLLRHGLLKASYIPDYSNRFSIVVTNHNAFSVGCEYDIPMLIIPVSLLANTQLFLLQTRTGFQVQSCLTSSCPFSLNTKGPRSKDRAIMLD